VAIGCPAIRQYFGRNARLCHVLSQCYHSDLLPQGLADLVQHGADRWETEYEARAAAESLGFYNNERWRLHARPLSLDLR
jgi:hypothetical protein